MGTNENRILDGLKKAIEAEGDGYNFYSMAAMNTQDDKGREVFQMLAREELDHVRFLKNQYNAILRTGLPDEKIKLPKRGTLLGPSPIFSENLRARIKDAHMEMSALSIGIQLELNAINFYKQEAEAAENESVTNFYNELVEWEQGHYQALLTQQESLKNDYWSAGGFSPF